MATEALVPANNTSGSITISSGTGKNVTTTQVKVTYPRAIKAVPEGTAYHDGDKYALDDERGLHIFKGQKRIASYREWCTVELVETTSFVTDTQPYTFPIGDPPPLNPWPPFNPIWPSPHIIGPGNAPTLAQWPTLLGTSSQGGIHSWLIH